MRVTAGEDLRRLVSQVMKDAHSGVATDMMAKCGETLIFTEFLRLEVSNAIRLAVSPGRMNERESMISSSRAEKLEADGTWAWCRLDWGRVFQRSIGLSLGHTSDLRSRTLDILHVASAMELGVREFWTFDEKQKKLADRVGLRVND